MSEATDYHKEALERYRAGDFSGAEQPARHVHDLGFQCGTFLLAEICLALERPDEARRLFDACAVDIPAAFLHLGDLTGDPAYYHKGHKRSRPECSYKYGIHLLHAKKGSPQDSLRYFRAAIVQPGPLRGEGFYALAVACLKTSKYRHKFFDYLAAASSEKMEQADELFDQVDALLDRDEFRVSGFSVAMTLFHEDNPTKALAVLKPKESLAHYAAAFILCKQPLPQKTKGLVHMAAAAKAEHAQALLFFKMVQEFV
jgi:hypothetical protein